MRSKALTLLLAGLVGACGSEEPAEVVEQIVVRERGAPEVVAAVASTVANAGGTTDLVALGEDTFQMCKGCHALDPGGRSTAGPNLYGVMGRKAGSLEGYSFSDAFVASDVTWDEASLDGFLADPQGYIPGSEMLAGTVADKEARAAVIAYLAAQGE